MDKLSGMAQRSSRSHGVQVAQNTVKVFDRHAVVHNQIGQRSSHPISARRFPATSCHDATFQPAFLVGIGPTVGAIAAVIVAGASLIESIGFFGSLNSLVLW
jgi:hypothetical protein